MVNAKFYEFNWTNGTKYHQIKEIFTYKPITKWILFLLTIFIIIYLINSSINNILAYSLALASPFVTVTLIQLIEGYSSLKYEKNLKFALINEIIHNLHSIKANENVINFEYNSLPKEISTDPLIKMIWDVWDSFKFHHAFKSLNFESYTIYEYIRGLYVLNEAINERKLYTVIDFSARSEYNKVISEISLKTTQDIINSLKALNVKVFIFQDPVNLDKVASTLNKEKIPAPIGIRPLFENKLDELIIIVNQN